MDEPIKSLDDLKKGDIVFSSSNRPYIVHAFGEVPEHEKEVTLCRLWEPQMNYKAIKKDSNYPVIIVKESEIPFMLNEKKDSKDYLGWQYFSPQILTSPKGL
ncbi:hypothetical protein HOE04_02865 [archaeon]|jgi:hypothetical protein|nr:hypothetical protein [archaeon]